MDKNLGLSKRPWMDEQRHRPTDSAFKTLLIFMTHTLYYTDLPSLTLRLCYKEVITERVERWKEVRKHLMWTFSIFKFNHIIGDMA